MTTRLDIKNSVKNIVIRQPSDIDTKLNEYINTGVELFSSIVESVFDESFWEHTFTLTEINSNINNWQLPTRTKRVISCAHIDTTGTDNKETPMFPVSPADKHRVGEIAANLKIQTAFSPDTFPTSGWNWDFATPSRIGTFKRDGKPVLYWRLNNNIFVYPRPDTTEENNKLEIVIATKPALLNADTDTNSITDNYPQALVHYVAALLWFEYHQPSRGQIQLQTAAKLLEEFATDDEIQKLLGQHVMYADRR